MIIKQLGVFVGAEVTGIDLTKELYEFEIQELILAHANYGVLVFPGQTITSEDLKRFGRYFGSLTVHPFAVSSADAPELTIYDHKAGNPPLSTDVWHTDQTFLPTPPMGTVLCSKIIPTLGGDTVFSNMNSVYEGLPTRWKIFLSGLNAVHNLGPFKTMVKDIEKLRKYEDRYPPQTHPVITQHPVTGKKCIFVNPLFTTHIEGLEADESRMILEFLYKRTQIHEYQYRHKWTENTLVFWDNRLVQHSAVHDYYPNRRLMERITINGTPPIPSIYDSTEFQAKITPDLTEFDDSLQKRLYE
jgi:taurine dioxygenase